MGYKMGQQFLYHLLHGLSLRKSSIKNHNNIISDWVIIRIKHKLGPTKPNKWYQSPWLCGAKVAKVIKVSFVGGVETGCVYLNLFRKWSRERYISPRKPIKPTQMILEKAQQRNIITNGARQWWGLRFPWRIKEVRGWHVEVHGWCTSEGKSPLGKGE